MGVGSNIMSNAVLKFISGFWDIAIIQTLN